MGLLPGNLRHVVPGIVAGGISLCSLPSIQGCRYRQGLPLVSEPLAARAGARHARRALEQAPPQLGGQSFLIEGNKKGTIGPESCSYS